MSHKFVLVFEDNQYILNIASDINGEELFNDLQIKINIFLPQINNNMTIDEIKTIAKEIVLDNNLNIIENNLEFIYDENIIRIKIESEMTAFFLLIFVREYMIIFENEIKQYDVIEIDDNYKN